MRTTITLPRIILCWKRIHIGCSASANSPPTNICTKPSTSRQRCSFRSAESPSPSPRTELIVKTSIFPISPPTPVTTMGATHLTQHLGIWETMCSSIFNRIRIATGSSKPTRASAAMIHADLLLHELRQSLANRQRILRFVYVRKRCLLEGTKPVRHAFCCGVRRCLRRQRSCESEFQYLR